MEILQNSFLEEDCDFPMSPECWDLINSLLCEPEIRLGKNGDFEEILRHSFFNGITAKTLKPPFIPHLVSEIDLSYFQGVEETHEFPAEPDTADCKSDQFGSFDFKMGSISKKPEYDSSLEGLLGSTKIVH